MNSRPVFDVSVFLERRRIGPTQLIVLAICALAMMVDGYDVYVVGYVLPAMARYFGVHPAAMTPVLLVQQVGLALGSFVVSPIADRFGRKTVLMASAGAFGVFTLLATGARSIAMLTLLRFLAGLFFSGVIPNAIALTSEISPPRARSTLVTIMFCGYTFGTACGGYAATLLLGRYGWQGAFWAGGLLPLAMLPLIWLALPESLPYRINRDNTDPRIGRLLRRLDPALEFSGQERFVLREAHVSGAPVGALFRDGRSTATILLWFSFFMSLLGINLASAWSSTFFTTYSTMTLQQAAGIGVVMACAGIASMMFYGAILDRLGATRVLTVTYVLGGLAVASLGVVPWFSWPFYLAIVVEGACVIGAQSGLNALSAVLYPSRMRATGVGWAFGAGRIGSMLGPIVGGFVLVHHWTVSAVFLACATPSLLVAIATFMVGFGAGGFGTGRGDEPAAASGTLHA